MISLAMDAHEGRHVATADVEGVYMHANMDDKVIMIVEGKMVDYMIFINNEYEQYVHTKKKEKRILYVQLQKALYGCMQSALLLWFKLFPFTLTGMGSKVNSYDQPIQHVCSQQTQPTVPNLPFAGSLMI